MHAESISSVLFVCKKTKEEHYRIVKKNGFYKDCTEVLMYDRGEAIYGGITGGC